MADGLKISCKSHEGGRVPRKHKGACGLPLSEPAEVLLILQGSAQTSPGATFSNPQCKLHASLLLVPLTLGSCSGAGHLYSSRPLHALLFEGKGLAFFRLMLAVRTSPASFPPNLCTADSIQPWGHAGTLTMCMPQNAAKEEADRWGRACAKMLKEKRRKVLSGDLEEQERSLKELFSMWLPDPRCLRPEWLVPALGLSGRNEAGLAVFPTAQHTPRLSP